MAIAGVVRDLRRVIPEATIVVVDNGSGDATAERALSVGAEVIVEARRGKAHAVLAGFAHIEADLIVMIDGDGSYPAEGVAQLLDAYAANPCDMITGVRKASDPRTAYRPLHRFGSAVFALVFRLVFNHEPRDLFSGLRVFTKRFYKNVPILFRGFELETELTVQAIDKRFSVSEVDVSFGQRAPGSSSKLRTVSDGLRILRLLFVLFRDYRPLVFFGVLASLFFVAGLLAGLLPIYEYVTTRMVGRFPLAILAAALMNLSLFTLLTGVMLESSLRHRRESYQIALRNYRP